MSHVSPTPGQSGCVTPTGLFFFVICHLLINSRVVSFMCVWVSLKQCLEGPRPLQALFSQPDLGFNTRA